MVISKYLKASMTRKMIKMKTDMAGKGGAGVERDTEHASLTALSVCGKFH